MLVEQAVLTIVIVAFALLEVAHESATAVVIVVVLMMIIIVMVLVVIRVMRLMLSVQLCQLSRVSQSVHNLPREHLVGSDTRQLFELFLIVFGVFAVIVKPPTSSAAHKRLFRSSLVNAIRLEIL